MKKILKLSFAVSAVFLAVFLLSGCGTSPSSNSELQAKCADSASKFFDLKKTNIRDQEESYTSHFNSKMNKCFILIYKYFSPTDFVTYDLQDVAGRRQDFYAMYRGNKNCSADKCKGNAGYIWSDGDGTKDPDVVFGAKFSSREGGDENTQRQFLDKIQSFMND